MSYTRLPDGIANMRVQEREKYNDNYFDEHYWAEDLPGKTGNRGLHYDDPDHSKRFSFLADLLCAHFSFTTFLDAGCGPGLLLRLMARRAKNAVGFDVSAAAAKLFVSSPDRAPAQPAFVVAGIENIPFSDDSFELTFCSDVMEHIPVFDIARAAEELARVTKTYLVLTINMDNPYSFHPTILSRETWDALFLSTGKLERSLGEETQLQEIVMGTHPEYSLFVYRKQP